MEKDFEVVVVDMAHKMEAGNCQHCCNLLPYVVDVLQQVCSFDCNWPKTEQFRHFVKTHSDFDILTSL